MSRNIREYVGSEVVNCITQLKGIEAELKAYKHILEHSKDIYYEKCRFHSCTKGFVYYEGHNIYGEMSEIIPVKGGGERSCEWTCTLHLTSEDEPLSFEFVHEYLYYIGENPEDYDRYLEIFRDF